MRVTLSAGFAEKPNCWRDVVLGYVAFVSSGSPEAVEDADKSLQLLQCKAKMKFNCEKNPSTLTGNDVDWLVFYTEEVNARDASINIIFYGIYYDTLYTDDHVARCSRLHCITKEFSNE